MQGSLRYAHQPSGSHDLEVADLSVPGLAIRLHGIDTPELGEAKAAEATRRLAALWRAGPVTIVPRAEDVYGRLVVDVFVRGQNVADMLRREGFETPGLDR